MQALKASRSHLNGGTKLALSSRDLGQVGMLSPSRDWDCWQKGNTTWKNATTSGHKETGKRRRGKENQLREQEEEQRQVLHVEHEAPAQQACVAPRPTLATPATGNGKT